MIEEPGTTFSRRGRGSAIRIPQFANGQSTINGPIANQQYELTD
jgi:hypothetical protein